MAACRGAAVRYTSPEVRQALTTQHNTSVHTLDICVQMYVLYIEAPTHIITYMYVYFYMYMYKCMYMYVRMHTPVPMLCIRSERSSPRPTRGCRARRAATARSRRRAPTRTWVPRQARWRGVQRCAVLGDRYTLSLRIDLSIYLNLFVCIDVDMYMSAYYVDLLREYICTISTYLHIYIYTYTHI